VKHDIAFLKQGRLQNENHLGWRPLAMRVFDIGAACLLLAFLAPLLVLVALLIYFSDRGPILFSHQRLGLGGRPFGCLKFRTMLVDSEERLRRLLESDSAARAEWARDHKLRHDPRITALGRFLRKTSIDELPQLWNVLQGQMSLVGPRPIVRDERVRYGRYFTYYSTVRPGITGLWQVSGRNDMSYRRRVACDVVFARKPSLRHNAGILLRTIPAVLMSRGSY
jgi:lipopolysaccharide/colanic/teichoic acid biosynthesis glycosyltransferase